MRSRFPGPDAAYLIDLLIRLGDVGSFDLHGSLRTIGTQIGELLARPVDAARLSRGVRALSGRTCVVERVSRQLWCLRLAGASDPASPHHRRLLAETPTPCRLDGDHRRRVSAHQTHNTAGDRAVGEVAEELAGLRGQLAIAERKHGETSADLGRAREELAIARADVESARYEIEEQRRQLADARSELATIADRHRQLEEVLVEREVERENLTGLVATLRMEHEQTHARGPVQLDESRREAALKGTLKLERERRHDAEVRLRRILGVLRTKLGDVGALEDALADYDAEELAPVIAGFGRLLLEHAADLRRELDELERSPAPDMARLALLRQDAETAELLARHAAGDR